MEYNFSSRVSNLKPSAIREILKFTSQPGIVPFAAGNPAPEAFPVEAVQKISSELFANTPIDALQYSITEGYMPLRQYLKAYMQKKYNVGGTNDGVIITAGAQQVMDLATKAFCDPGDVIVCENPSFIGSLNAFRSYQVSLKGVDMEPDGMNMQQLEQVLATQKRVKLIYTIPNFQNPSGITMSLEKRKQLYALAQKYNVVILEDNPYGDIRFAGTDLPAIKSMDTDDRVIYAGTFSKVLAPGIRVGFCIANEAVLSKIVVCKQTSDVHTNIFSQMLCYKFMTEYDYEGHLVKNQQIYKKKADLMMSLLDKYLAPKITYNPVEGGLFIWCRLPAGVDMMDFCSQAVQRGVAVVPGTAFNVDEAAGSDCFRINYSTPTDQQMVRGMEILGQLAKEIL